MTTDALLLQGLLERRQVAFEAIFERYYPLVHGLLYRLVGDEADDLAMEVFWRLYQRPPRLDDPAVASSLRAWLCRVAMHLGCNALRTARRRDKYEQTYAAERAAANGVASAGDPVASVVRSEEQLLVRRVLAQLSERQAALLLLRHSGMSYREIAESLGLAAASVGTLLARAERAFAAKYALMGGQAGERSGKGARE